MSENTQNNTSIKIGDFLKKSRQGKRIELKTISQKTKINLTMLEYLEDSQLDKLPNRTYVTGYIKSYAQIVGLDFSKCINILEKSYGKSNYISPPIEDEPSDHISQKKFSAKALQIAAIIGVPSLYFSYVQIQKLTNSNKPPPPTQEIPAPERPRDDIAPQVLSSTTPLVEEKEIPNMPSPQEGGSVMEPEKEPPPKEDIVLRPIRAALYSFAPDNENDRELIPNNYRNAVEDGQQSVFITATESETWLTYQKDGGPIRQFFLQQGQHVFITGNEVLLFLGRVTAVKVFLNNRLLQLSSPSGVKTLIFPQENRTQYFYPLFIYKDDGTVLNSKDYNALMEDA